VPVRVCIAVSSSCKLQSSPASSVLMEERLEMKKGGIWFIWVDPSPFVHNATLPDLYSFSLFYFCKLLQSSDVCINESITSSDLSTSFYSLLQHCRDVYLSFRSNWGHSWYSRLIN
jgi:hypothetical protein